MNLTIFAVIKAVLVRLLFVSIGVLCVRSLVQVKDNVLYWFMMSTAILSIFEATITLTTREGGEWKWFYPSFAIALLSTVPTIWILELDIMKEHIRTMNTLGLNTCIEVPHNINTSINAGELAQSIGFTPEQWSLFLQQILLFTLILGRWMLPKGSLTRDQLSQLLLVFIGIAADILEFSTESLKLETVRCNETMIVTILTIWTWSLLQFTLGLTVTKSRKTRLAGVNDRRDNVNQVCDMSCGCCETETWGIMVTIIMQDGPFFITRMYLIFHADVINQGMIFFTCKNLMVLLLQFYRLLVLYFETPSKPDVIDETGSETNLEKMPGDRSYKSKNKMSVVEEFKTHSTFSSISTPTLVADT
ncbi:transmembrane protein 26-like [Anneissia japonica]|uniref:transmembrane protein 26-like n=1 Tax=Anneissia japonica TaxID=1529436 RepID=UPI0014257E88|nr:transmembrane protein 26-like [Anneissia japonica]